MRHVVFLINFGYTDVVCVSEFDKMPGQMWLPPCFGMRVSDFTLLDVQRYM